MPTPNLATPATLFEACDPLDEELSGQPLQEGTLEEVVVTAMEFADCRLATAKIVTADHQELHAREIEEVFRSRFPNRMAG